MSLMGINSPFDDFRRLENEITSLFRNIPATKEGSFYRLPVNIEENNDEYKVVASLPGYNIDEIDIEATSQYLNISASKDKEKEEKKEENGDNIIIREITHVNLQRRISFDKPVDTTKASTKLENGMLTIVMPKAEEAKAVKLIPKTTE